jgi:hypothetical protein
MAVKSPKSVLRDHSSSTKTWVIVTLFVALFVFMVSLVLFGLAWRYRSSNVRNPETPSSEPKVIVVTAPSTSAGDPPVYPRKSPDYPLRNVPRDYQQVGVLVDSQEGGEPTILALFGRKMQTRDRWEYYAASDKFHMWKLPVQVQKRMCDHEFGCDEIYNGDQVIVPDYGNRTFTARIYAYAPPGGQSYL